ncbi:hypothetical protein K438DRAFT_1777590 [Mycena galopus ATCC 62051]|nr:hypothetical protein K438DRAFT_1777590 [Mycena galopus ATCC 62051]
MRKFMSLMVNRESLSFQQISEKARYFDLIFGESSSLPGARVLPHQYSSRNAHRVKTSENAKHSRTTDKKIQGAEQAVADAQVNTGVVLCRVVMKQPRKCQLILSR